MNEGFLVNPDNYSGAISEAAMVVARWLVGERGLLGVGPGECSRVAGVDRQVDLARRLHFDRSLAVDLRFAPQPSAVTTAV
jgi:hypothetical protein